jgi:hypothetical protein
MSALERGAAAGVRWTRFPVAPAGPGPDWSPAAVAVVLNARLDGRLVPGTPPRVDRTHVAAFDGVVDEPLRADLLTLLLGPGGRETDPAPPSTLWERATADAVGGAASWGLRDGPLAALSQAAPASPVGVLGARLTALFPGTDVLLLPSVDMGGETASVAFTPVLANAPVCGDTFNWHTDADPSSTPAGTPWGAAFGRYVNGDAGRPRLVTLIVHLCSEWHADWAAETLFRDSTAGVGAVVAPAPGRVVLFDGDVMHRLVPPSPSAGRPRYSLAWRLALAPRSAGAVPPSPADLAAALVGAGTQPADLGSAAALTALVRRVAAERKEREEKAAGGL